MGWTYYDIRKPPLRTAKSDGLLELPVLGDDFVDGGAFRDHKRGVTDLHGQGIFDPEGFRGEGALGGNVAKRSVDRVGGHGARRGDETLD